MVQIYLLELKDCPTLDIRAARAANNISCGVEGGNGPALASAQHMFPLEGRRTHGRCTWGALVLVLIITSNDDIDTIITH
jgi:hypothetical protein